MQSQNIVKNAIENYLKLNNKIIGYIDDYISIAKKENLVVFGFIKLPTRGKPIFFQVYPQPDYSKPNIYDDIVRIINRFRLGRDLKSTIGKIIAKSLYTSNSSNLNNRILQQSRNKNQGLNDTNIIPKSTLGIFNELINSIILGGYVNYGLIIKSVNFSLFKKTKEDIKEILENGLGRNIVGYTNEMLKNDGFIIPIDYKNGIIGQYIEELSKLIKSSPEIIKIWYEDEINRLFKLFNTIYKTTSHIPITYPFFSQNDNSLYYIIHLKPLHFDTINNDINNDKTSIEPLSNKIGKVIYMDLLEILTILLEMETNNTNIDNFEKLISQFLADVVLKQYINQTLSPIGTINNGIRQYYLNNILDDLENIHTLDNRLDVLNNPIYEKIFGIKFITPLYIDNFDGKNEYKFIITPENINELEKILDSIGKDIETGKVRPLDMETSLTIIPQLSTRNKYNTTIEINIIGEYNEIFDKLKKLNYSLADIYRILSNNSKYLTLVSNI